MALGMEYSFPTDHLQSSLDSPYRTPSLRMSRHSSQNPSSSPVISSSPPALPHRGDVYFTDNKENDVSQDEKISILDPRRFTPSLHANLVSEILSLRREVESKNSLVLSLEENLHAMEGEKTKLNGTIASNEKENRAMKRQMELLENGTLSALEEVAKEKDQAIENLAETRRRLEIAQKKVRSQEEEANRAHSLWNGDRQQWESEKRILDRKVHVAESRLKTILSEVEVGKLDPPNVCIESETEEAQRDDWFERNSALPMTAHSLRPDSALSNSSLDSKVDVSASTFNGATLADELNFDDEEAYMEDGYVSPEALPEEAVHYRRPFSVQSHRGSSKARKLLGLAVEEEEAAQMGDIVEKLQQIKLDRTKTEVEKPRYASTEYTSTATQFSPPASPQLVPQAMQTSPSPLTSHSMHNSILTTQIPSVPTKRASMVSQACQTIEQPLSPPQSPVTTELSPFSIQLPFKPAAAKTESIRSDEFTDPDAFVATHEEDSATSLDIPVIAIHPPITHSTTPQSRVVLPPRTKSVGCQVSIRPLSTRSVSIQTEEIRIDNRPVKLPPHLLPSSISSKPSSPVPDAKQQQQNISVKRISVPKPRDPPYVQPKSSRRNLPPDAVKDSYPGNNDNGPLNSSTNIDLRRPVRSDSLFAGFDALSDEEPRVPDDAEYSDDSFGNKEPIRKTLSKVQNSWKLIPQTTDSVGDRLESTKPEMPPSMKQKEPEMATHGQQSISGRGSLITDTSKEKKREVLSKPGVSAKQPNIRRTALISSGTAAHAQRSQSPSASNPAGTQIKDPLPPFPVPTRESSRRIPISASDGAQSPTPQSTSYFSSHLRKEQGRPPKKAPVLRKIRSAAAATISSHERLHRNRDRSPPPPTASSSIPESPQLPPPMPVDDITSPRKSSFHHSGHRHQPSNVSEAGVEQTSVVDAIAQTMIGEWMWKYVRRRKSFGMPESAAAEFERGRNGSENSSINGERHKRWVWLAPYERAVMWSSKQPTSGSALMGKNGRKLIIQSVLDVKDDTPMPRSADTHPSIGRSILILTPQRALKFTATSKERHYVWLAALSFLSHSSLGTDDLASLPPVPPKEYYPPAGQRPMAVLRRNPIRDSIRIAKDKSRPDIVGRRAFTNPMTSLPHGVINAYGGHFDGQKFEEAAEPPLVPRYAAHTRQRSNTGPARSMQPSSFLSFSSTAKPSNHSLAAASSDTYAPSSFGGDRSVLGSAHSHYPRRDRDGSTFNPVIDASNFFDAVGTVRMEAFVERTKGGERGYYGLKEREKSRRQGWKRDIGHWGIGGSEVVAGRDPFEDF